jgi:hypothetical protein
MYSLLYGQSISKESLQSEVAKLFSLVTVSFHSSHFPSPQMFCKCHNSPGLILMTHALLSTSMFIHIRVGIRGDRACGECAKLESHDNTRAPGLPLQCHHSWRDQIVGHTPQHLHRQAIQAHPCPRFVSHVLRVQKTLTPRDPYSRDDGVRAMQGTSLPQGGGCGEPTYEKGEERMLSFTAWICWAVSPSTTATLRNDIKGPL